ncbi:UNVERIFIED_CONTAM: hypothetical protein PYX00_009439 [Menopon gallinae]|uniref:HTH CENPB-type domain-containing protein n=1 Tax=Menopon gallinae TaxID=328185 RepID=A0AAW2HBU9_9NEOP
MLGEVCTVMRQERLHMQRRSQTCVMEPENGGQLSSKKTRRIIDLETKVKVIRFYEGGKSVSVIARQLDMPQSTIATILRNRDKLTEAAKGSASMKLTRLTKMREGPISDMESLLMSWIEEESRNGNALTASAIKAKARSVFEMLKEKAGPDCDVEFSASSGWYMRFKNRYSVDSVVDSISADMKTVEEFAETLDGLISEGGYVPEQIFNIDETYLFWKRIPLEGVNDKKPEPSKDVVTVLLGGNAAGYKLKPLVVWNGGDVSDKTDLPVHCKTRLNAFQDVFLSLYLNEMKNYCADRNVPFNILLLVDGSRVVSVDGVKAVVVPQSAKKLVQPADRGVFAAFKAYYLRRTVRALEESNKAACEFWKEYDAHRFMKNIAHAWDDIPKECMTGVWRKILTRFPIEPWRDDEVVKIAKSAAEAAETLNLNECEEAEILEVVPEELTNVELLELEQPQKSFTERGLAEFFKDLDKLLKKAEDMDPDGERFSAIKRKAKAVFADYRKIYEEKRAQRARTRAGSSAAEKGSGT